MKKLWYLALALYFCTNIVPNYVFAYHPASSQEEKNVEVGTKKQEGKTDYFHYQLNIPTFDHIKNKGFEKKLNSYYETNILSFKKKLEAEAKKYYDAAEQTPTTLHPYVAQVDYKVTLRKPSLVSLYISYYQYTGGAHGMYEWKANTFDIDKKKELSLADLFQQDSKFIDIIKQEIKRQINQDSGKFFPDAAALVDKATTFKFFLEPEHIVLYYPLYEIAPYASGIPTFRIPYTLLENDLKSNYRKILIDK